MKILKTALEVLGWCVLVGTAVYATEAHAQTLTPSVVEITGFEGDKVDVFRRPTTEPSRKISITVPHDATVNVHLNPVPVPPHMHGGVQGILWDNPIIASFDGIGFIPGIDTMALSDGGTLNPVPDPSNWEEGGAVRQVCKAATHNNDDAIVFPGQQGPAHDHTHFSPQGNYLLTDANVRAAGNKSTCRGGTLDLTARWMPSMYETVGMRAIVPHSLLVYYKPGTCPYSIDCSASADFTAPNLYKDVWPPEHMHLIAGDPAATAPTGVVKYTCIVNALGFGEAGKENLDTIPKCKDDGSESLWVSVKFPQCLKVNPDGTPVLDSPDHKSHAAYMEGWPAYNSPLPGKAYRCPLDHPYPIAQITFLEIFDIGPGMDTSTWNLSCGSPYCGHGDWFDGWKHQDGDPKAPDFMVQTGLECLQKRRDCGTFQIFDGRTALEFQGN